MASLVLLQPQPFSRNLVRSGSGSFSWLSDGEEDIGCLETPHCYQQAQDSDIGAESVLPVLVLTLSEQATVAAGAWLV